jgi:hypothetical protein
MQIKGGRTGMLPGGEAGRAEGEPSLIGANGA